MPASFEVIRPAKALLALVSMICLLILVLGQGCVVHLDRNAPGLADITRPPAPPRPNAPPPVVGQTRPPQDPGEHRLLILPGGLGGPGIICDGDGCSSMAAVSVETTVLYGETERSHSKPTLFGPLVPLLLPRGIGATLGAVVYQDHEPGLGPLYVEGEYSFYGLFSGSAGYAVDVTDGSHGPQISLSAIGLYVRNTYLFGRGNELLFGMVIKLPVTVVWSR